MLHPCMVSGDSKNFSVAKFDTARVTGRCVFGMEGKCTRRGCVTTRGNCEGLYPWDFPLRRECGRSVVEHLTSGIHCCLFRTLMSVLHVCGSSNPSLVLWMVRFHSDREFKIFFHHKLHIDRDLTSYTIIC
jgi:hypothetical protein